MSSSSRRDSHSIASVALPPPYEAEDDLPPSPPRYEDHATNGVLPPPPVYQAVQSSVSTRTRTVQIARVARTGMTHNVYINHFNNLHDNEVIDDVLAEIEAGRQSVQTDQYGRSCGLLVLICIAGVAGGLLLVGLILWARDRD